MQNLKHKVIYAVFIVLALGAILMPSIAFAANDPCHPETNKPPGEALSQDQLNSCENCKNTLVTGSNTVDNTKVQTCLEKNPLVKDLQMVVDFLSALVGIVVVGTIILGGIQYTLAGDNQTATAAAKKRIANGLLALAVFLFAFAFLQWLIPGGIFS